jgi:hypothetical protein
VQTVTVPSGPAGIGANSDGALRAIRSVLGKTVTVPSGRAGIGAAVTVPSGRAGIGATVTVPSGRAGTGANSKRWARGKLSCLL